MRFCSFATVAVLGSTSAFVRPSISRTPLTGRLVLKEPTAEEVTKPALSPTEKPVPAKAEPGVIMEQVNVEETVFGNTETTPKELVTPKSEPSHKENAVGKTKPLSTPFFVDTKPTGPNAQIMPGRYDSIEYSIALPFLQKPPKLDGSHAGDYGFDPMGFTEDYDLYYMQECELRHARLAMLSVVGWPMSELLGPDFMLVDGRAPSVLNGFNLISGGIVLAAFAAIGFFEYATSLRRTSDTKLGKKHLNDMEKVWDSGVAGDYSFDPLGFYDMLGDDAQGRKAMRGLEISHGRWAMVGISGFAFLEALTGKPIVEDNILFHPNPVIPIAALSYFVWSQFYQVSDVRKYPIRVEYTNDGEEMIRSIKGNWNGGQ